MMRIEALEILARHGEEIRELGVRRMAVFGSVVRDEAGPESDVDVLVEFEPEAHVGLFEFLSLKDHLEKVLGVPVDLGTFRSLKRGMKDRVLSEAVDVS